MAWEAAKPAERYREHSVGWDTFVPRLGEHLARLVPTPRPPPSTTTCGPRSGIRPVGECFDLLLADGDGTATSLSEQPVTRQAIAKHPGVLDRIGLVHATPAGRERRYRLDEAQLARAVEQLSSVGAAWDARFRRIKRIAEAIQRTKDQRGTLQ